MILPVLFLLAMVCGAQDFSSPARELARKIGRPDVVSVTVRNASSLPDAAVEEVRRTLESELRARPRAEGSAVSVTLSENVQGFLWVAEIARGEEREVAMLEVARTDAPAGSPAPVAIDKRLVWEQDRPLLDVGASGSVLIALEPSGVFFFRDRQLVSMIPIPNSRPVPRDPRGRLEVVNDSFRAFVPGLVCNGVIGSVAMNCSENGGAGLTAGRNFFSEPPAPAYFSSAVMPGVRVIAAVDGSARVYDSSQREIGAIDGWGSDIAAVESGCGAGRQVLASRPGEPDAVQAYEMNGGRAMAVGDAAPFAGPITALWSTGKQALAIARNPETGRYAAYSLAITCSR